MNKFKDKYEWFWCYSCKNPSIKCEFCDGTACNGGSCEKCHADFVEAWQMVIDGTAPKNSKGLPKRGGGMEAICRMGDKANLSGEEFDREFAIELAKFRDEQDALAGI